MLKKADKNGENGPTEIAKEITAKEPCAHTYLKKGKEKGEKICIACGAVILIGQVNKLNPIKNL